MLFIEAPPGPPTNPDDEELNICWHKMSHLKQTVFTSITFNLEIRELYNNRLVQIYFNWIYLVWVEYTCYLYWYLNASSSASHVVEATEKVVSESSEKPERSSERRENTHAVTLLLLLILLVAWLLLLLSLTSVRMMLAGSWKSKILLLNLFCEYTKLLCLCELRLNLSQSHKIQFGVKLKPSKFQARRCLFKHSNCNEI